MIKICVLLLLVEAPLIIHSRICSSQVTQGPYTLQSKPVSHDLSASHSARFEIYSIEEDATVMILYRAYWKSMCYNGGSMDGNTGCYDEYKDILPDTDEVGEWWARQKCKVQEDCEDCWGSDSDQCNGDWLLKRPWHYVTQKELTRSSNNNHFAHHTCNLQMRCGFHSSRWPTFLKITDGKPEAYILSKNNTPIYVTTKYYQKFGDYALLVAKEHRTSVKVENLTCHGTNDFVCYDQKRGNLINLKEGNTQCFSQTCYLTREDDVLNKTSTKIADLKGASLEDLKAVQQEVFLNHEELKYNFLITKQALEETRKAMIAMTNSLAKIDDRLIGELLERPARTKFLSKKNFLLSPCSEDPETTSNCVENLMYSDGRWTHNPDVSKCVSFNNSQEIVLWNTTTYWLPDIVSHKMLGTLENQEGWSFYAQEKNNLIASLSFTRNMGKTSALGDAFSLPAGSLKNALNGFLIAKILYGAALIVVILLLIKILLRVFR